MIIILSFQLTGMLSLFVLLPCWQLFGSENSVVFNDTGKDQKLMTAFEKIPFQVLDDLIGSTLINL